MVGKEKGVVRLEKATSKKGNEYWKVVEVLGATNGLKLGAASPLNMSAFPNWLRDSASSVFIRHGDDFDELLKYETEE